jgi:hypothetical protein
MKLKIVFECWNDDQFKKCKKILEGYGMVVGNDMIEWENYLAQK